MARNQVLAGTYKGCSVVQDGEDIMIPHSNGRMVYLDPFTIRRWKRLTDRRGCYLLDFTDDRSCLVQLEPALGEALTHTLRDVPLLSQRRVDAFLRHHSFRPSLKHFLRRNAPVLLVLAALALGLLLGHFLF